jgi:hypothetical protein
MFGGTSLYGADSTVPVRELLQNAMDAIQARRRLQNRTGWGLIRVELSSQMDGVLLSVEDDGVGMSERVLTGSFLDFGSSFWRSIFMREGLAGIERHPAPGCAPVKADAALEVARELFAAPVENRINWTLPRLAEEIERRTGHRISRSRLSVVLRKKGALPTSAPATR